MPVYPQRDEGACHANPVMQAFKYQVLLIPNGPMLTHVANPRQFRDASPRSYVPRQSMTTHPETQIPAYNAEGSFSRLSPLPTFFLGEAASASEEAAAHLYVARRETLRRCLIRSVLLAALPYNNECVTLTVRAFSACHGLPSQGTGLVGIWHPDSTITASFKIDICRARKRATIDALVCIQ